MPTPILSLLTRARRAAAAAALLSGLVALAAPAARASTTTVSGTITYTYTGGQVLPDQGLFIVTLTSNPAGSGGGGSSFIQTAVVTGAGNKVGSTYTLPYYFANIADGVYYVSAFRDANGNGILDGSEPWGAYSNGAPDAVPGGTGVNQSITIQGATPYVSGSINRGPYNFNLGDVLNGKITGTIFYSGASTGTLYVEATTPNPYGGGGSNQGQLVSFTTAAWTTGTTSSPYTILVPAATGYNIRAFIDVLNNGANTDSIESEPSIISSGAYFSFGVAAGANVVVSTTLVTLGYANALPTNATVSGTLAYGGAQSGNFVVGLLINVNGSGTGANLPYTKVQPGAGTFTVNVTSPPLGGCYYVFAGRDVNGDGRIDDTVEPSGLLYGGSGQPASICAGGDFAFAGSNAAVGTITIVDPTNSGQITGTVTIASGTVPNGQLVVRAQNQCSGNNCGGGIGSNTEAKQAIALVPGTYSYPYTLRNLGSATNYFVQAWLDTDLDQQFMNVRSTFNSTSGFSNLYFLGDPIGSYGQQNCVGSPCVNMLTQPVVVTTNAAMATFFGNTCGANHATACPSQATASGVNILLQAPTTVPPPAVALSTSGIAPQSITWSWLDVPTENGFRLVDTSSRTIGPDLPAQTLGVTQGSDYLGARFSTNTAYTSALVSFNTSGNSTSSFRTVYTAAAPPTGSILFGASFSTATIQFSTNTNPAYTYYNVQWWQAGSTTTVSTLNVSSNVSAGLVKVFVNPLPSNATTYLRAQAVNGDGVLNPNFDVTVSTILPAALPVPQAPTTIGTSSFTVNFAGGGNAAGTQYLIKLSTDPTWATFNLSVTTTSTSWLFSPLGSNTTYFINTQALAVAPGGISSQAVALSTTVTAANVPASPAVTRVDYRGMSVSWSANNNQAGTTYLLQLSTDSFASISVASQTLNTSATFYASLQPNTTYYPRVQAINWAGAGTAFVVAPASSTIATAPASGFLATTNVSATVNVTAPNSTTTVYNIQLSTDPAWGNLTQGISYYQTATSTNAAVFAGLIPNTQYYARARAIGNDGSYSAFSVNASGWTQPNPPSAAASTFTAVTPVAVTYNWAANGNPAGTSYVVEVATDPALAGLGDFLTIWDSSVTANVSATFPRAAAVIPNTTFYYQVQSVGNANTSPFVIATSLITPATAPAGIGFTGIVTPNSITVQWASGTSAGYNPLKITNYTVTLSTVNAAASFAGSSGNISLSTTPAGAQPQASVSWQLNAVPNATYYAYVSANGNNGASTPFVFVSSGISPPAVPAAAAVPFVNASSTYSASVAWTNNGNTAGTNYGVILSTVNVPGSNVAAGQVTGGLAQVIASTTPALNGNALQATFATGLVANTTYFLYVNAGAGGPLPSAYANVGSTSTLAAYPGPVTGGTTGANTFSFTWSAGSASGGVNPAGTLYNIVLSTVNVASPAASSAFAAAANSPLFSTAPANAAPSAVVSFGTPLPNATYYTYISAVNNNGIPTLYTNAGSGSSLANQPTKLAATFVSAFASSATVAWGANGNPPNSTTVNQTTYTVTLSTVSSIALGALTSGAAAGTVVTSTNPSQGTAITGLSPNSIYFAYVSAINNNGVMTPTTVLGATATQTAAPATFAPPFAGVTGTSAFVQWGANGNPANNPYLVIASSVPTLAAGALAAANNVSLSTSPSGTAPAGGLVAGLSPGASWYFYAAAQNAVGLYSSFTPLGSTITLAVPVATAAATAVGTTTATANWGANGNPAGTVYVVYISTDFANTANYSQVTTNTSSTFTGLLPGTNYTFYVNAQSYNGAFVGPTILPPVSTGGGLTAPASPAFTGVGVSSAALSWSAVTGAANYYVLLSTDPAIQSFNISSRTANTAVTFGTGGAGAALLPNTAYFAVLQASGSTVSPFTPIVSTITFANPPIASGATAIYATSATINWALNGNPVLTTASIDRSTVSTFAPIQASSAGYFTLNNFTPLDLIGCTPYWFRVRNINNNGIATTYDTAVNFTTTGTTPTAVGSFSAGPSTSSNQVALSWYGSASEGVTRYNLYMDNGNGIVPAAGTTPFAIFYATGTAIDPNTGAFTALTPRIAVSSPSYTFRLNAYHGRCGVEEAAGSTAYSPAISTTALAAVRAVVTSPVSGATIGGGAGGSNSLSVTGAATSGTPSFVAFQYAGSANGPWVWIASATQVPYSAVWDVTPLALGTYFLRAQAYDVNNTSDTSAAAISITLVAPLSQSAVVANLPRNYVNESVSFTGLVTKTVTLQTGTTNSISTVYVSPTGASQVVDFVAPPNLFGAGVPAVAVQIIPNPQNLPTSPTTGGITTTGLATQISPLGGVTTNLSVPATIKISYGTLPAGVTPDKIQVYVSHAGEAFHVEPGFLATAAPDTVNNKIVATTTRLSFFAGFGTVGGASADLSSVRAYPVPYKPNSGNADEGGPGIIFDQITQAVTIKIYTLSGRQVARFDTSASGGSILWDTRNQDGRRVASGGYLAVISASGMKSVVKKLVVIR